MESNNIREFDIVGQRYGYLVVVSFDHYEKGASYWLCRCDCGGEKIGMIASVQVAQGEQNTERLIDLLGLIKGRTEDWIQELKEI